LQQPASAAIGTPPLRLILAPSVQGEEFGRDYLDCFLLHFHDEAAALAFVAGPRLAGRPCLPALWRRSHVALHLRLQAIFLGVAGKKSISASRLGPVLGMTLKTAWFMDHRIRLALTENPSLLDSDGGKRAGGRRAQGNGRRSS
jgi:hypothetical protein